MMRKGRWAIAALSLAVFAGACSDDDDNGTQPQLTDDPEDGLDVDELGDGSVRVRLVDVTALDNRDAGIDLDEADDGDLVVTRTRTTASGRASDGFSFAESGDGELRDTVR